MVGVVGRLPAGRMRRGLQFDGFAAVGRKAGDPERNGQGAGGAAARGATRGASQGNACTVVARRRAHGRGRERNSAALRSIEKCGCLNLPGAVQACDGFMDHRAETRTSRRVGRHDRERCWELDWAGTDFAAEATAELGNGRTPESGSRDEEKKAQTLGPTGSREGLPGCRCGRRCAAKRKTTGSPVVLPLERWSVRGCHCE